MDILIRQHIEAEKKLLPIWLGVEKSEVENRHLTLSGIVAITEIKNILQVVSNLVEALSDGAPSRGVIPGWENPSYRFLQGLGEVNLQSSDGSTTTIFEFLLYGKEEEYPFWLAGKIYSKKQLLEYVAKIIGPVPERIRRIVGEDGFDKLFKMCVEHDLHPNNFY